MMQLIKPVVFLATLLFFNPAQAGSTAHDWAKLKAPAQVANATQSIGSYTNGCLSGAVALPLNGAGYQVMRLSRTRYYGHPDLIAFIQHLGQSVQDAQLGTLLIGDLGQVRGGPTLSGHRSHQTGLDVDIWFAPPEMGSQHVLTAEERESLSAVSMVNMNTDTMNSRYWQATHEKWLELAAQHPSVDRIFVNPAIKQHLCSQKTIYNSHWLRKIRPWWKHDDHFHVRLKCPPNNPYCEGQEPLPASNGCDASLAWWFSQEAKAPAKPTAPPTPQPALPFMCEQLLHQ